MQHYGLTQAPPSIGLVIVAILFLVVYTVIYSFRGTVFIQSLKKEFSTEVNKKVRTTRLYTTLAFVVGSVILSIVSG